MRNEKGHYVSVKECAACHYKYSYDYDDRKVVEGDADFIDIDITATYEYKESYYGETRRLAIIMCPKCNTLKGCMN